MSPGPGGLCSQASPRAFLVMSDRSRGLLCASISRANSIALHQKGRQSCRFVIQPSEPGRRKQHIVLLSLWGYFWTFIRRKKRDESTIWIVLSAAGTKVMASLRFNQAVCLLLLSCTWNIAALYLLHSVLIQPFLILSVYAQRDLELDITFKWYFYCLSQGPDSESVALPQCTNISAEALQSPL